MSRHAGRRVVACTRRSRADAGGDSGSTEQHSRVQSQVVRFGPDGLGIRLPIDRPGVGPVEWRIPDRSRWRVGLGRLHCRILLHGHPGWNDVLVWRSISGTPGLLREWQGTNGHGWIGAHGNTPTGRYVTKCRAIYLYIEWSREYIMESEWIRSNNMESLYYGATNYRKYEGFHNNVSMIHNQVYRFNIL